MDFTQRELATVLASLRNWQMELSEMSKSDIEGLKDCTPFQGIEGGGLNGAEIDDLCERLNVQN